MKIYKRRIHMAIGPSWMFIARGEIGEKEIEGLKQNNPRIKEYLATSKIYDEKGKKVSFAKLIDETPWCSAFVKWAMKNAGYEVPKITASSQSWKRWGTKLAFPKYGAITVFPSHVAFFVRKVGSNRICVLGGNQKNQVKESTWEANDAEYRWPIRLSWLDVILASYSTLSELLKSVSGSK